MNSRDYVVFVYSKQQIDEDRAINAKINRNFIPGEVSVGSDRIKYSKILLKDELPKMTSMYPDSKIVAEGTLGNFKYTKINNDFIR